MITFKRIFLAFSIFVFSSAWATETVSYELQKFAPGIFSSSWDKSQVSYEINRIESGKDFYRMPGKSLLVFDRKTFSMASVGDNYQEDLKVLTDKENFDFFAGTKWKSSFAYTPRTSSGCKGELTLETNSVVSEVKTIPILMNGKSVETPVVVVKQEGTWSVPGCASGTGSATFVFATEKNFIVSMESLTYYNSKIVAGTKLSAQAYTSD